MITSITFKNFRQFETYTLEIKKNILIIYGNNTKGKTTILESIYLMFMLNSPWSSDKTDLIRHDAEFMRITAKINKNDLLHTDKYDLFISNHKKILSINDIKKSSEKFTNGNTCTIFTPEQIEFLMYLPAKRRAFLNAMINKYDLEYANILQRYMKALQQRNSYLKKLKSKLLRTGIMPKPDTQLDIWTGQLVETMFTILKTRMDFISAMNKGEINIVYKPLGLKTFDEEMFSINGLDYLREILNNQIRKDISAGFSTIGIHRDDWHLKHKEHNIKRFGSRGEKRVEVAKLIMETQEVLKQKIGYYPILLLDDVSAELDDEHTKSILNLASLEKQQTIITTVNLEHIPKDVQDNAQVIYLN
jgi:DNA replication and repair protein RecF